MKLGLDSSRKLFHALGDPQNNYLKVQIAGTNGKGSVCAFLDAICNAAGIRTGLTTSPHLVSITERVRINGQDISEGEFARMATRVRDAAETLIAEGELETVPTYFEQVTAIALLAFAEANVRLAILETGLGGRLDATTAADAELVAITRIDYDHQQYLGSTLPEIAAEKAAIINPDATVVVGPQKPEAMKVILDACKSAAVKPILAEAVRTTCVSGSWKFRTDRDEYCVETPGLLGNHQLENATVAILLAEALRLRFAISAANIVTGLESARHPGRLEQQGRYLFDGAHNIGGAKALGEYLDEFVQGPITMIFGAMNDKDVDEIAKVLFPKADLLIITEPDNSRALSANEIAQLVPVEIPRLRIKETRSVSEALAMAADLSETDGLILVTGSLYLVGEAKKILNN